MKWRSTFLASVFLLLLVLPSAFGQEDHDEHQVHPAVTEGKVHDDHKDHEGGHHGVRLASWRWEEYYNILIVTFMIIIAGVLKLLFHHTPFLSTHFPESCVLILIGILIGIIVYFGIEDNAHQFPKFTSELFFNVLLPPIILDAAYSLYDKDFLSNLASVIFFAVVGTIFNVFIIGYALYLFNYLGWMGTFPATLDTIQCLIFASLISAVDPVAVLAIFEEIGVNPGLYFLVFGESLLNDGVTVVIYNTMVALAGQKTIEATQYVLAFFSFFFVVFGGLMVGVVVGLIMSFILKFTEHTRVIEPLIVFAMSYFAFILAETIHWSGIIALIGCGIVQKRYAFLNISKKSYTTVKYTVKTFASFSDCIIFLFLGIVTVKETHEFHTGFILWTVGLCLLIRFAGVFLLSTILNTRRLKPISLREQFIMAYGGLRGAVGFSLVTILDDKNPFKNIFVTTTLVMIFFTVFIQGGTIKFLVQKLKIKTKEKNVKKMLCKDVHEKAMEHAMAGVESVTGHKSRNTIIEAIRRFDKNYTKKILVREGADDLLTLRFQRITLDDHYARLYGPTILATKNKVDVIIHDEEEDGQAANRAAGGKDFGKKDIHRALTVRTKRQTSDELEELLRDREAKTFRIEQELLREGETRPVWKKAATKGLAAEAIKQQYQEAKAGFKPGSRPTSMPLGFQERESTL